METAQQPAHAPAGPPPGDPASRPRRSRIGWLNLVVSAIALGAVALWISRQEAPALPSGAGELSMLAAAVGVHLATMVVRGWRWHRVLRVAHIRHESVDAFALVPVGYMGNTVLPARGGEVLRILLLSARSSGGRREILGTIIAERLLDVVALVALLVVVTASGVAQEAFDWGPAVGAVAAIVGAGVAIAVYLRMRRRGSFSRFAELARPFARATKLLWCRAGLLLCVVSLGIWLLEGAIFMLAGESIGIALSLPEALLLVVLANFFALLPAAPGYVGTYDAAILFGASSIGVVGREAVGFALVARCVTFLPVTLAGLVLLVARYGGLRRLREAR